MTPGTFNELSHLVAEIHRATSEQALRDLIAAAGEPSTGSALRLELKPADDLRLVDACARPRSDVELELKVAVEAEADPALVDALREHLEIAVHNLRRSSELAFRAERFEALIDRIPAVTYFEHATDDAMIYVSPQIETAFGIPRASWLEPGDGWAERIHDDDRDGIVTRYKEFIARGGVFNAEYRIVDGAGRIRWVRDEASRTTDEHGNPGWVQGVLVEITDRKDLEARLSHLAYHDPLTDLANRALFRRHVAKAVELADRAGPCFAVLYLDLDGFKAINDRYGHLAGDRVLTEIAHRIRSATRPGDFISREGGDEFAILLSDLPADPHGAVRATIRRLARDISAPMRIAEAALEVATSIGSAVFPGDGCSVDVLLEHADREMYDAKQRKPARSQAA